MQTFPITSADAQSCLVVDVRYSANTGKKKGATALVTPSFQPFVNRLVDHPRPGTLFPFAEGIQAAENGRWHGYV